MYHSKIWILNIYVIFVQVFPSKIVTIYLFIDISDLGYNKLTQFDFFRYYTTLRFKSILHNLVIGASLIENQMSFCKI